MNPTNLPPEPAEPAAPADADVLREQRDANEHLVLATLRARDAQDSAEHVVESLRASAEELRLVADFRERLIGIVSHDLRSPLNAMLLASGLLVAHGKLSESDGRLVNRIVDSGQRMARMITQVLEFTRGTLGGGFSLQLQRTDLGEIFREIAEELRLGATAAIEVTVAGDVTGSWDADRLAAVVSNLVGNAVDHAAPETAVVVAVRGDDVEVVAEVSNLGICIPPASLPTIFLPFRSGPDEYRRVGHMGLGLYISREIVRSHGGTLEVRSDEGSTTFTLRLPRQPPSSPSRPPAHRS